MKAYEFPCKLTADGKIELPGAVSKTLPSNEVLRVIVLVRDPDDAMEEEEWRRFAEEQFLAGYGPQDAIYDTMK